MKYVHELLPIGSVVLLKEGIKKVMITGMLQQALENNQVYDYLAVLYPEGFIGNDAQFLFNHEDINDVIYVGYDNPERQDMLCELEQILYEQDNEGVEVKTSKEQ